MSEQESHDVAMCVARTYAETGYGVGVDAGEFGKAVAEAYAAARARLLLTPEERQAEAVMLSEEYARHLPMIARSKAGAG